jgi:hypothetical protein
MEAGTDWNRADPRAISSGVGTYVSFIGLDNLFDLGYDLFASHACMQY